MLHAHERTRSLPQPQSPSSIAKVICLATIVPFHIHTIYAQPNRRDADRASRPSYPTSAPSHERMRKITSPCTVIGRQPNSWPILYDTSQRASACHYAALLRICASPLCT